MGSGVNFSNQSSGEINIHNSEEGLVNEGSFVNEGNLFFDIATFAAIENFNNFTNSGLIGGNAVNLDLGADLGGILSPGFSPGRITFASSQSFAAGANLLIEVDGATTSIYDRIIVAGVVNLNNLSVEVTVNYTPQDGDRIDFINASAINGNFASISLPPGWELFFGASVFIRYNASILPVEWSQFAAKQVDNTVDLNWQTATESNNKGFEIEYSIDGAVWKYVDFVAGAGNSQQIQAYEYTHKTPALGQNYYRLKQIDLDGSFSYSPIRSVYFAGTAPKVHVFPNPATQYANISLPPFAGVGHVEISAANGQPVFQSTVSEGDQHLRLELQSWPAGLYLVTVRVNEQFFTQKLLITDQ